MVMHFNVFMGKNFLKKIVEWNGYKLAFKLHRKIRDRKKALERERMKRGNNVESSRRDMVEE